MTRDTGYRARRQILTSKVDVHTVPYDDTGHEIPRQGPVSGRPTHSQMKMKRALQICEWVRVLVSSLYMLKRETYEESQRVFYNLVSGRQRSREILTSHIMDIMRYHDDKFSPVPFKNRSRSLIFAFNLILGGLSLVIEYY